MITNIYATNDVEFEINVSHNLICCDCGLVHSVKLRTNFFSKRIFATYNREDAKTQTERNSRNIAVTQKDKIEKYERAFREIIVESGKVDIKNWPCQQQICQAIAQKAVGIK